MVNGDEPTMEYIIIQYLGEDVPCIKYSFKCEGEDPDAHMDGQEYNVPMDSQLIN